MVDGIFLGEDQLGDGHKGVALLGQLLQDAGQGLGGVKGRVVEENDGPGAHLAHHPLLDLGGGDLLPVQTIYIPLDGLHANGAHRLDGAVVIVPVGQAHQGGPHPGDGLDLIVAGVEVGHHLLLGELGVVGMGVGMVHHLVSRLVQSLHRLRILVRPLAHYKEGCFNVVLAQNINELLGVLVPPGRIKGDGHQLLVPLDAVNGQLPGGGHRPGQHRVIHHPEHHCRRQQTQHGPPPPVADTYHIHPHVPLSHAPTPFL